MESTFAGYQKDQMDKKKWIVDEEAAKKQRFQEEEKQAKKRKCEIFQVKKRSAELDR